MTSVSQLLRSNRDYRLIWLSGALSGFGDFIFETTILIWIATELADGKSWAPSVTSAMLAASAIPVLLIGPFAGVFADRLNPRTIRLVATSMSAALIFGLSITAIDSVNIRLGVQIGLILGTVALASAVAQFLSPAAAVMVRDIVAQEDLGVAAGASQSVSNFNMLIAPALAALLYASFGPFIGMTINALSFVAAAGLVSFVGNRPEWQVWCSANLPGHYWSDFRAGIIEFGRYPVLRILSISLIVLMVGGGVLNGLDVFFIKDNLGASNREFGLFFSAQGAGMLLGSIVATWVLSKRPVHELIWIGLFGMGVVLLVYARLSSVIAAIGAIGILGIFIAFLTVAVGPVMMTSVPREFIGRVSSLINPLINIGSLAGLAIGGISYSLLIGSFDTDVGFFRFRPIDTLFMIAALMTIATGIWSKYALDRILGQESQGPVGSGRVDGESS